MKAIGIDIGTTGICGVLLDRQTGAVERSVTKNSNAFLEGCAPWERIQSVDKILGLAEDILDSLTDEEVGVIGVTGQMHGILYFDAEGRAISPLYTWQDGRGNLLSGDTTYAKRLHSFSGYGCVTDLYNRENGIRPAAAVGFCTVQDYLVMHLCGLKRPLMHATNAAGLGTYSADTATLAYDPSIKAVTDFRLAGEYRGIPVSVAIGDNQASVFSTLIDEDKLLVNVGTGSQVSIVSDRPAEGENIETRPYFDGKYLVVGSALCGGRAYSLLKEFFASVLRYREKAEDEAVYAMMGEMLKEAETAS